jgi:hypothetical protein
MEKFKRFLMSQRLGRVIAEISLDRRCRGLVRLTAEDEDSTPLLFAFRRENLGLLSSSPEDWRELLVRLAVSQAHKDSSRHGHIPVCVQPLSFTTPLWLGDLMRAPYGGATFGVEMRKKWRHFGRGAKK